MKKTRKIATIVSVVVLLVVSLALTLTSCAPKVYKLTFDLDGAVVKTIDVPSVGTPELPDTPVKVGYTFGGWYFDKDALSDPCTAETIKNKEFAADTVAYAKWTKNEYTINYTLDGGINGANPSGYAVDTATIKLAVPTKVGYTFGGWYSEDTFVTKVTEIAIGSTGNKTLFAKWTKNDYTITYTLNGGENAKANPSGYSIDTATITLSDPTKVGYTFDGWYGEDTFATKVTEIAIGSTGNKTLFAKWNINTYNITYAGVDGVGVTNPNKVATYNINTPTITIAPASWKEGAVFVGWSMDGDVAHAVNSPIIADNSTGDITFTAHWTFTDYAITYNLDGGINNSANPSVYTLGSPTIKFEAPTKRGYTFLGWFTKATDGVEVKQINSGSTGAVIVYANWEITTYNITYAGLDGVGANKPTNANNTATTYNINTTTFTIQTPDWGTIATFVGWSTDGDVAHAVNSPNVEKNSTGDITFTAHWTFTDYAINYELDGGINDPSNANNYNIDTATITLLAPAHSDSVDSFDGWFDAAIGGNQVTTIARGSTGALTLYAHWTYTATAGLTYNIINGNEYEVTCATSSGEVVIPRKHDNKLVTKIAANAFLDKASIMRLSIPSSVKSIGDNAFKSCSAIASLKLPDGLTSIGTAAFESCSNLNSINIPDGVTSILTNTFKGCRALISMKIPESVASIGIDAFSGCAALTSVNIPSKVKIIEKSVFRNCAALASVIIPTKVESIGDQAFAGCASLASVIIHGNVKSVGASAFAGCTSLARVTVQDGVTSIGDRAFYKCPIVSIFIPNTVTTMGGAVFQGCTDITISCERAENPLPPNWNDTWMGDVTNILWGQTRPAVTP